MKKTYTFLLAAAMSVATFAQQLPVDGKYYYIVNAKTGDQRLNSCFGIRTKDNVQYYGAQEFEAGNDHLLWRFVASEEDPTLYAMVNRAGEYLPAVGIDAQIGNSPSQDARYEVTSMTDNVIPDEAFGFYLNAEGTISDTQLANYDATIHGMQVGDTYFTIKPKQWNNRGSIEDNTQYYIEAAGSGRDYLINLWVKQDFPDQTWIAVPQRQVEEAANIPAVGKYYHLVTGITSDNSRKNKVFGVLTLDNTEYYGVQNLSATDLRQQWTFVPDPDNKAVYAMVNNAGEYVTVLGTIVPQNNGTVGQDTRFAVTATTDGVIPSDAYGFAIDVPGEMTETNITNYNTTLTGMQVGDPYIMIRPLFYRRSRNNPTSPKYVGDNVAGNNPIEPTTTVNDRVPPFYINVAGNARQFAINLWHAENGSPATSECWILVEVPAPAAPEFSSSIATENDVVTIPANGSSEITLTVAEGAKVAYAFVEATTETEPEIEAQAETADTPEFTISDSNTVTLTIDKAGTLYYYALIGGNKSEQKEMAFVVEAPTSISEISVANPAPTGIYDLQGRRVVAPTSGLYIINGHKTLVK